MDESLSNKRSPKFPPPFIRNSLPASVESRRRCTSDPSTSLSRPAWVQCVRNDASVDELIAIQALEDAGYSTASSLPSSSASTPAKAGRHGDTSREYDGGLSRHAGAAVNDAVVANPHDNWANVTVFPDASPIPQRDDPEPLTADEEAELAEL